MKSLFLGICLPLKLLFVTTIPGHDWLGVCKHFTACQADLVSPSQENGLNSNEE